MSTNLRPATFTFTQQQLNWLKKHREKTGLKLVEIVRRALDFYAEAEEAKERRQMFTLEQRNDIKAVAQMKGVSELDIIRAGVKREISFLKKLENKRGGNS